jgi:hypothetical protein
MAWELTDDERREIVGVLQATLLRDRSHTAYARSASKDALLAHCARLEAAIVLLSTREPEARARARSVLPVR